MELRNLRTFLRVAEVLSFSRAAESLYYTQSAVTIQIKQLEGELGVELFERIGRNVCLTRYGEQFVPYASEVIGAADAAANFLREPETPKGPLRIGTVESLCTAILPGVLRRLHKACPLVETTVRCGAIERLLEMLFRNEVDVLYLLDKKLHHSEWVKASEKPAEIVFVVNSGHRLAGEGRVGAQRVVGEPFILTEEGVNYRHELEQRLAARGLRVVPYLDLENTGMIVKMLLRNDESVSFLPYYTVRTEVTSGRLALVSVRDVNVTMWKQLIYHRKKSLTLQMRFFIEEVRRLHAEEE